jgi:creatinine amidohydrolase/Fe(II)-dependent formamide hydrolase-like protein
MRSLIPSTLLLCALASAQPKPIEFEMMTWVEVKQALESGKTTALVYNGGTEQRGPQNVNGGHTLIAREVARRMAEKLGNAIVAPVLPFSVNNASAKLPGTIGLTPQLFADMNEQVAEQLIITGFKNVVLMGDHGGGQKELGEVAKKLDAKYSGKGIRVVFCDGVYVGTKEHPGAQADFEQWLGDHGYPSGGHAGVSDTSEMLYLGGDKGWVRKDLIAAAVGDPVGTPGQRRDPNAKRIDNGITGDARKSTAQLGKQFIDMKVDYGVKQIRQLLAAGAGAQN